MGVEDDVLVVTVNVVLRCHMQITVGVVDDSHRVSRWKTLSSSFGIVVSTRRQKNPLVGIIVTIDVAQTDVLHRVDFIAGLVL